MNKVLMRSTLFLLMLSSWVIFSTSANAQTKPWVDGYYTGYGSGTLPTNQVDYSAMSTVIDFAVVINSNGSLDATSNGVTSIAASSVAAAHAAGTKVIVSFGGAGDGSQMASAISSNLSGLVSNIANFVKQYGYDGCDIDMEPVGSGITSLVQALRAALPSPYIITATSTGETLFSQCYQYLDQINIMSYDLAGNWQGWVSWYNGALYMYGSAASNGAEAEAGIDVMVNKMIAAGIPASKIGIGSEFGGAVWSGVTGPNQTPGGSVSYDVAYNTIKGYGGTYTWDSQAQASYTVSSKGWATYDDTADVGAKMRYVKSKGLGGLIIWSLDMDHKTGTTGQDPLLNAVKANWGGSGTTDNTPPSVSIASPTNGSTVSGTISFSANASDNVGVSSVVFIADGNQIGSLTSSPYTISYNTTSLSNGSHSLSATAYDAAGNSSTSSVSVTVSNVAKDTTAPVVSVTAPAKNATVSGTVSITASASDNVGVASVQFKIDGSNLGNVLTASPYSMSWNTTSYSNGSHTISATATDAAGNSSTSSNSVTVSNVAKDTTAPVISVTAPAPNATVSGTVSITASASDNVGVASVQFKIDGANLGNALTASPYSASWNTASYANGSHTIAATATDAAGNSSTSSVSVTVSNVTKDTTAPVVSVTAPAKNATVSGTVSITASASDNVGVASVQFKIDGANLGNALTASPYSASWSTTNYANGSHTISATATDAAGNSSTSSNSVTVSNVAKDTTAPVVSIASPLSNQTVSGSVSITANASDNVGVASVQFKIDGYAFGSPLTASPFTTSWTTTSVSDGAHTISAVASDAAGNSSTATITVNVSNQSVTVTSSDAWIYKNGLASTWSDGSWGTTDNLNNTSTVLPGCTSSVQVKQNVSGGFRLLSGGWNALVNVDPTQYLGVSFALYAATSENISVFLMGGPSGVTFPTVNYGTVPAGQWTNISIPLSQLDPTNQVFTMLVVENTTNKTVTYYLDNIRLSALAPPLLLLPGNGATNVHCPVSLTWNPSAGSTYCRLQVSANQSFSPCIVDSAKMSVDSLKLSSLNPGTTYYWRVDASAGNATCQWSPVWSFATAAAPPVAQGLTIYSDSLQSPWMDASWSATMNYSNASPVFAGSKSISVVQGIWGSASLHYGDWGSANTLNPSQYAAVQFEVYSSSSTTFSVLLEDDLGSSFPTVAYGSVPTNQWTAVSVPMSQLDPSSQSFTRIDILEESGVKKTYYLDNIMLSPKSANEPATLVIENSQNVPASFSLAQNYPNPFNPSTTISFSIAKQGLVTLKVYNMLGQEIATLADSYMLPGSHNVVWNASNVASGVYIYRLQSNSENVSKKMILMK